MMILEADATAAQTWVSLLIQVLVTAGGIFGCAGFWQWKQSRDQAKRDKLKQNTGVEGKVDILTDQVATLITTVGDISTDLQEIKNDVTLLQKANDETVKYRELRDANDKKALIAQQAVIISLKGLLRERLLDNYNKCVAKGYYTKEERETYGEMFKCYESEPFDGNGIMHQLQPIMIKMPWTAEEAEERKKNKK